MKTRMLRILAIASLIALPALWHSAIIGAEKPEQLIVKCARPCAAAVATVAALGGETTQIYDNVDAVAVSVPTQPGRRSDGRPRRRRRAQRRDRHAPALEPDRSRHVSSMHRRSKATRSASSCSAQPDNYNYNNGLTGAASTLHAAGVQGQNVIVGLIDSGTASAIGSTRARSRTER